MKPYLICELGLHGEGSIDYHLRILKELAAGWPGWPPLIIKTQTWTDPGSAWAKAVATDRAPLAALTPHMHRALSAQAHDYGFAYATTVHDVASFAELKPEWFDFIKLGSFDLTQQDVCAAAAVFGRPLIVSEGLKDAALGIERRLDCVSAYPANAPLQSQGSRGYSCHSVPALIPTHVKQAAPYCHTIEVHVTARPRHIRPMPKDYCVSLSVPQFLDVAEMVGQIWRAE